MPSRGRQTHFPLQSARPRRRSPRHRVRRLHPSRRHRRRRRPTCLRRRRPRPLRPRPQRQQRRRPRRIRPLTRPRRPRRIRPPTRRRRPHHNRRPPRRSRHRSPISRSRITPRRRRSQSRRCPDATPDTTLPAGQVADVSPPRRSAGPCRLSDQHGEHQRHDHSAHVGRVPHDQRGDRHRRRGPGDASIDPFSVTVPHGFGVAPVAVAGQCAGRLRRGATRFQPTAGVHGRRRDDGRAGGRRCHDPGRRACSRGTGGELGRARRRRRVRRGRRLGRRVRWRARGARRSQRRHPRRCRGPRRPYCRGGRAPRGTRA